MKKNLAFCEGRVSYAWSMTVRVLGLSCFLSMLSLTVQAQAELIKDIDQREEVLNNEYRLLTAGSTNVYFVSGNTLWKSSGTTETTTKLKTFTSLSSIAMAGNTAYFGADDGSGLELWKSNGTITGTVRVKDIWPGSAASNPQHLTNVNGTVYFTADNGKNGRELWKSNGSPSGTVMVNDVKGSSSPTGLTNVNGTLYFSGNNGTHGYELWKSNGTAEGTLMVKDIRPGSKISSSPQLLTRSNGMLFFTAVDDTGRELWKSDGTEAGTVRIKDIRIGGLSDIENLIDVNGTVLFTANDGVHGAELWKTNGTEAGTVLVKDMNPGSAGSNREKINNFRSINGKVFFTASQGYNDYLYRSDGTAAGTVRIMRAFDTGLNNPQPIFTYLQGYVYFFNVEGIVNGESYDERGTLYLWKMHINDNTPIKVKEFHTPISYADYYYENYEHAMVQCNGALYIVGRLESTQGFKLIRSDGTAAGSKVITDTEVSTLNSNPTDMVSVNGLVFFRTKPDPYDYAYPSEYDYSSIDLYGTDGTPAGTFRLPFWFQDWNEMEAVGNSLFYTVENGGWELNKTDGTTVSNITIGSTGEGRPTSLTAVGNVLYYTNGFAELWKSDGTSQGTERIKDFVSIKSITDVGGKAFILAETSTGGLELWRKNATGSITRVKIIRTSAAIPSQYNPTATQSNIMYFVANDGVHGNEIWQSDGTATGTFMILDLNPHDPVNSNKEVDIKSMAIANGFLIIIAMGQNGNWPLHTFSLSTREHKAYSINFQTSDLIAVNNKAFFIGDSQLYVADGSGAPLVLGDIGMIPDEVDYAVIGNILYISVSPYSSHIWRTDGTECGTIEIHTGDSSYPIAAIGNDMIMGAASNNAGLEPHIYRKITDVATPCVSTAIAMSNESEEAIMMTPYPNPFTSNFTLLVHGTDHEIAEVGVYTATGFPVEKLDAVKANTEYPNIGSNWPKGMYIVKVSKGGKLTSHTVIKR